MSALGFIECRFVSICAVVADTACKSSEVTLLGMEPSGTEQILIRLAAESMAALEAALERAAAMAERLGVPAVAKAVQGRPDPRIPELNAGPVVVNGIYGGREEFRPDDFNPNLQSIMKNNQQALGILETQGLTASLEATDAMLKAADVHLVGKEKIGAAYVTIMIRGDVAAVSAAIEAGKAAVGDLGKLIAGHVIARPHEELTALLPAKP